MLKYSGIGKKEILQNKKIKIRKNQKKIKIRKRINVKVFSYKKAI